jgi:hypothetical protein
MTALACGWGRLLTEAITTRTIRMDRTNTIITIVDITTIRPTSITDLIPTVAGTTGAIANIGARTTNQCAYRLSARKNFVHPRRRANVFLGGACQFRQGSMDGISRLFCRTAQGKLCCVILRDNTIAPYLFSQSKVSRGITHVILRLQADLSGRFFVDEAD